MADSEALTLDQADAMLVKALELGSVVARHFNVTPLVEVLDYIAAHESERKWVLGMLGLTNAEPFAMILGPSEQLSAFSGIGSLLEIVTLLKQYAPLIKQYLPQIKQALELAKVLFDLWKQASPATTEPGTGLPPLPKY